MSFAYGLGLFGSTYLVPVFVQEIAAYKGPLKLSAYKQAGKGKGDAVRLGFEKATGDLLMILDADLTGFG